MSVEDELRRWLQTVRGVTCYRDKLKIYAPTCYGRCLREVEELIAEVNKIVGGSTVYDAEGSWVTPEGRVETEPVKVIEAAHHCLSRDEAVKLARAITEYARKANQSAIAVEAGSFYIAETPRLLEAYRRISERLPTDL